MCALDFYWKPSINWKDGIQDSSCEEIRSIFYLWLVILHTKQKMPTYVYQEILPDGSDGEAFEYIQGMADDPLIAHPKTGNLVQKVFHSPNVSNKYTEGSTKKKLTDENVEKHGFTRYEKDKVTGRYHKTAGKDKRAPDVVDANKLKEIQQNGLD